MGCPVASIGWDSLIGDFSCYVVGHFRGGDVVGPPTCLEARPSPTTGGSLSLAGFRAAGARRPCPALSGRGSMAICARRSWVALDSSCLPCPGPSVESLTLRMTQEFAPLLSDGAGAALSSAPSTGGLVVHLGQGRVTRAHPGGPWQALRRLPWRVLRSHLTCCRGPRLRWLPQPRVAYHSIAPSQVTRVGASGGPAQ